MSFPMARSTSVGSSAGCSGISTSLLFWGGVSRGYIYKMVGEVEASRREGRGRRGEGVVE